MSKTIDIRAAYLPHCNFSETGGYIGKDYFIISPCPRSAAHRVIWYENDDINARRVVKRGTLAACLQYAARRAVSYEKSMF